MQELSCFSIFPTLCAKTWALAVGGISIQKSLHFLHPTLSSFLGTLSGMIMEWSLVSDPPKYFPVLALYE